MQLPAAYEKEMRDLLKEEFDDYIKVYDRPLKQGLRVNRIKITKDMWEKKSPFGLDEVPWIDNGYFYQKENQPSRHPYYFAGLYYLQEPSAMTPANRLPIAEGDFVLDLCAAPGGKATELGGRLNGTGLLLANDISNSRAKALLKNIEMAGIKNSYVTSEDPKVLVEKFPAFFDKILIDAPCSGEGMFHKEPRMMQYWEERGPKEYCVIQKELILQGAQMLRPGGMMLYSTCTFSKKENEEVIAYLLKNNPSMHLVPIAPYEGFSQGLFLEHCVRIFPHHMPGEGHFLALLQKDGETAPRKTEKQKKTVIPKEAEEFFELISSDFLSDRVLKQEKKRLYLLPGQTQMPKLRYLRTGLYLGDIKKNRFEPSQSLAMALKCTEFKDCIKIPADDIRAVKYLKGETLDVSDLCEKKQKGWQLVCVDNYPMGFGKLANGTLKNKYYAGWRWQ